MNWELWASKNWEIMDLYGGIKMKETRRFANFSHNHRGKYNTKKNIMKAKTT